MSMTNERRYIENQFERLLSMGVKTSVSPAMGESLRLIFIAGMAAAFGFDGEDTRLREALLEATNDTRNGWRYHD